MEKCNQKRMKCECTTPPKGFRVLCKSERDFIIMTQPIHELWRESEHYDLTTYRCVKCGDEKTVGTGDLSE